MYIEIANNLVDKLLFSLLKMPSRYIYRFHHCGFTYWANLFSIVLNPEFSPTFIASSFLCHGLTSVMKLFVKDKVYLIKKDKAMIIYTHIYNYTDKFI